MQRVVRICITLKRACHSLSSHCVGQKTPQDSHHGVPVKHVNSNNNDDTSHAKRSTHGVKSPFGTTTTAVCQNWSYLLTTGSAVNILCTILSTQVVGSVPGLDPVLRHALNVSVVDPHGARLLVQPVGGGDFLASFYPI